jgi:low molecular weight protein-tyrosine phosphatase
VTDVDQDNLVRVLVVCTANRCRSPLAAALLTNALARRGQPAMVETAGLRSAGLPATHETVLVAGRRGFDLGDHESRRLARDEVERVDLVVGMERLHVREIVAASRSAWPRTFTLKELVRRGEAIGPRASDEPLSAWVARVHAGRVPRDLLGASVDDDVADPSGAPVGDHEDLANELEDLIGRLSALVAVEPTPPPIAWIAE